MDARTQALWKKHAAALPPLAAYPLEAVRFAAGDTLACAGEPVTRLCFVVEGYATVKNTLENGRAALLCEYSGQHTVGELELLMDYPLYASHVQATTRGAMLCLPLTPATRAQVYADAALLRFLGQIVAQKLERISRLASQDRSYPVAQRLAAYLLYAHRSRLRPMPLTRLSELVGASYRHLLRSLRALCDAGIVASGEEGYRVLDTAALAQLAGEIRYD
jgi:CRP-like cAMP-binding protein